MSAFRTEITPETMMSGVVLLLVAVLNKDKYALSLIKHSLQRHYFILVCNYFQCMQPQILWLTFWLTEVKFSSMVVALNSNINVSTWKKPMLQYARFDQDR